MPETDKRYCHTFPAIRGVQAGRPFYVAMCPARIIPKIFIFDEEEVPPELRAQRTLNRARIPEITSYLVDHPDDYVLSALTASVDASVAFQAFEEHGPEANMGMLSVPMEANILINDGQHRRAAIEEAIRERPELGQDNVPVLFFVDEGLRRSQQMFADLNKYAVRPSTSLGTLYDHRDHSSELARYIAMSVEPFIGLTEMERSSISNRSTKLFTLSSIKHANRSLLRKGPKEAIADEEKRLAAEYWDVVGRNVPDWRRVKTKEVSAAELRQHYIHAHGVTLHALGIIGADLLSRRPKDWKRCLGKLKKVDWSRSNTELWEGRAMVHGRISKSRTNIVLTGNAIKAVLGVELTDEEKQIEQKVV
jgi:DNA sulfur modification protein DndB